MDSIDGAMRLLGFLLVGALVLLAMRLVAAEEPARGRDRPGR